jgi:hypothetical protein
MKKLIASSLIALGAFASMNAQAMTVTFGGINPGDGSYLTSALTPGNANNPLAGIYVDTFDRPSQLGGGCGPNSGMLGVSITGNVRYTTGNPSGSAHPANDTTCYASGPDQLYSGNNNPLNTVTVDFTNALANTFPGKHIDYLGLYWGSIDRYNDITFYANGAPITISSLNGVAFNKSVLDGDDILSLFGGNPGDRSSANTNRYVNMFFGDNEQFDKFVMHSSSYAMEIDNVAIRVAIPEPSVVMLFGIAMLGLGLSSKRRKI